jgi:ADP-ribose pyrophosphatase
MVNKSNIKVLSTERVYNGYLKVDKLQVMVDGNTLNLERIERGQSAAVLVVDPKTEECLVTKQFRPAIMDIMTSTAAGMIDENERAEVAAVRELHEETGVSLNESDLINVGTHYLSSGILTEATTCFIAFADLSDISAPYDVSNAGESEFITVDKVPLDDLYNLPVKSASLSICILEAKIVLMSKN